MHTLSTAGTPAEGGTAAPSPSVDEAMGAPQRLISLEQLIGALAEAALVVDSSGQILSANRAATEMFEYPLQELAGTSLALLLPEQAGTGHSANVSAFFANPTTRPMGTGLDLEARTRSGRLMPVEISLGSIEIDGDLVALALVSDISDRAAAEKDLVARNIELDEFAQVVAHDLNTMVAGIMGLSEVLSDTHGELDAVQLSRHLQALTARSRDMARVIRELLIFARLEKGGIEVTPFNSRQAVVRAAGRLAFETRDSAAAIDIDPALAPAVGYAPWVEEVWYNLLANAIKHGGEPPEIRVRSHALGGTVRFMVEDSGPGVSQQLVDSIFDTDDDQRGRIVKGHGLGLGIVARIIEKLGGRVGIDLPEAGGSVFWFELPAP